MRNESLVRETSWSEDRDPQKKVSKLPENTPSDDYKKESRLKWYKQVVLPPALSGPNEASNATTTKEGENARVTEKFTGHVSA